MLGVLINCGGIIGGALLGRLLRRFLHTSITDALFLVLALFTLLVGIRMALRMQDVIAVLGSLVIGTALGTVCGLEQWMQDRMIALQNRWASTFGDPAKAGRRKEAAQVVLSTSVLYCTGAMAIVGPIESSLRGQHEILIAKGLIDGIYAATLAVSYGSVLALTAVPVLFYQGGIAVFSRQLSILSNPAVLDNLSGIGGILLMMIGIHMLKLRSFKIADSLPSIPLYVVAALVATLI